MDNLKSIDFPNSPGIYKFLSSENKILYVGKSKNLKKRVKSYFQKEQNKKISNMIKETSSIDFVLSESEHDALLLENNLIKENKPKYNILLRDDKSFPYIAISKERFPKIYSTRKINHQKEDVFGPYTNVKSMRSILKLIKNLYKIRNCNYVLSSENIENKKFKVCLEYHLGNCKGACENMQEETEYLKDINEIKNILKGRTIELTNSLKKEMHLYSKNLNYEKAQEIKDKIFHIESFTSKSIVVNFKVNNLDVFGIMDDNNHYFINFMKVNNGMIISSETIKVKKKISFDYNEIGQILIDLKIKYGSMSNDTISNISLKKSLPDNLISIVPKVGDKKSLIDMSLKMFSFIRKIYIMKRRRGKQKKCLFLLI